MWVGFEIEGEKESLSKREREGGRERESLTESRCGH